MRESNKFIFACLIALILCTPIFLNTVLATQEESVDHSVKSIGHGEEITEHNSESVTDEHEEKLTAHSSKGKHEEGHVSSHIWPHYGKMVIFAKIMLAFMLFSFIAPLIHFYVKDEKHH